MKTSTINNQFDLEERVMAYKEAISQDKQLNELISKKLILSKPDTVLISNGEITRIPNNDSKMIDNLIEQRINQIKSFYNIE